MPEKRPALGRGLRALIPDVSVPSPSPSPPSASAREVDLDLLHPNRDQPRRTVEDTNLDGLAQSIRTHGVIQPILVADDDGGSFEIIAGERRWRAAQRAGLLRVPVIVRDVAHSKRLELALIENIQREDLNPIEEAAAYARLAEEFGLTQEQIARSVGKDRTTVANYLRLLGLPAEVRAELAAGTLTMGHARAIAGLADARAQRHVAREIRAHDLSVRETEALVKRVADPKRAAAPPDASDVHTRAAEDRLKLALGTRVRIVHRGKRGRIEIAFSSDTELQRLYDQLTRA